MDKLGAPDLPAYLCYLLVFLIAMLAARSQVNRLLTAFPQRWGFLSTWALFWAHVAIPVGLFWFLDYTNALRDTSLFAALLVALGYRQIFAGGVDSIRLPGQTQRLWKPFEVWVTRLVKHITLVLKRYLDRFDEQVTGYLAADNERIQQLMAATFLYTTQRAQLEQSLAALAAEVAPVGMTPVAFAGNQSRKQVSQLLKDLRISVGDDYGYFLYRRGVIPRGRYWRWFGNVRSRAIAYGVTLLVFLLLAIGFYASYRSPGLRIRYSQWRFTKSSNSELDRFRNRNFLLMQLQAGSDPNAVPPGAILQPMLTRLRFKDCPNSQADDLLRLVIDSHQPSIDKIVMPQLIESLRTENPDVRLRIHRVLVDISKSAYDVSAIKEEITWVPARDDSAGLVDTHVRAWLSWWASARPGSQSAAPQPTPMPPASLTPAGTSGASKTITQADADKNAVAAAWLCATAPLSLAIQRYG